MQTLNLLNPEESGIKYEIFHFPDGEVQIRLGEFSRKKGIIVVVCRITNAEELFIVSQIIDILNRHEVFYTIKTTYLMSMRMDRVMDFNSPLSLKVVLSCLRDTKALEVFYPHNSNAIAFYSQNLGFPYEPWSISRWRREVESTKDTMQIVVPDEGAVSRNDAKNCIYCRKVRDIATGRITSIEIVNPEDITGNPLCIIDDLCDGGGTFVGIAKVIKEIKPDIELNIKVAHMVNPKGIENLSENFNHVWFTNSYMNWQDVPENVTVIDITQCI